MAFTSSTTAVAFFASYFSPLMPIKSFGVFAGLIIIVNYLMIVFIFPSAVIIQERYFKSEKAQDVKENLTEDGKHFAEKEKGVWERLEIFISTTWNLFVQKYRLFILGVMVVLFVTASLIAMNLGPLTE